MSGTQKKQQNKQTQAKQHAKSAPEKTQQGVNLEQLMAAPETMRSEEILAAQQQVGNQVVQRALDGNKKSEAMTDDQGYLNDKINTQIQQKRGGGSPLPDSLQKDVSKRFKRDFDDVRIHTDEQANELSQKINARAFTIGKDIFFKKGVFSPGSKAGRETIMHELTHVVQQSGSGKGASGRLKLGASDTAHEKQADKIGKANSNVDAVRSGSKSAVQREPDDDAMGAKAYSKGTDIHLGAGQDKHLGHEASHVVQQAEGRVKPTTSVSGMPVNDNPSLEHEADMMGEKGVQRMEEEELQMQPDLANVIQKEDDDDWDTDPDHEHEEENAQISRAKMSRLGGMLLRGGKEGKHQKAMDGIKSFDRGSLKSVKTDDRSAPYPEMMTEEERGDLTKKTNKSRDAELLKGAGGHGLRKVPTSEKKFSDAPKLDMTDEEKATLGKKVTRGKLADTVNSDKSTDEEKEEAQGKLKTSRREDLLELIKNPDTDPEKVKEAQEELKTFHKRGKGIKGLFQKSYSRQAMGARKEAQSKERDDKIAEMEKEIEGLQQKAEGGQSPEAFQAWKDKKAELESFKKGPSKEKGEKGDGEKKPSKMAKFGAGFMGGLKKLGGTLRNSELGNQFFGEKEKKAEPKKEAPAPVQVNVAGGGGGGGFAMLEKYITENQQLKAQVAELEKEKTQV